MSLKAQPKYHAKFYNFVAKRIRTQFPMEPSCGRERTIITTLALEFAVKFAEDNVQFDPLQFLDQCSPDPSVFPLSELWEDYLK